MCLLNVLAFGVNTSYINLFASKKLLKYKTVLGKLAGRIWPAAGLWGPLFYCVIVSGFDVVSLFLTAILNLLNKFHCFVNHSFIFTRFSSREVRGGIGPRSRNTSRLSATC